LDAILSGYGLNKAKGTIKEWNNTKGPKTLKHYHQSIIELPSDVISMFGTHTLFREVSFQEIRTMQKW